LADNSSDAYSFERIDAQLDGEVSCSECGSKKVWKDGLRYNGEDETQRYLCRVCGYRFSKPNVKLNIISQDRKLLHSSSNLTQKMVGEGNFAVEKSLDSFSLLVSEDVRSQDSNTSCITTVGKDLNAFLSNSALSQVGVSNKEAKNLDTATETQTVAGEKLKLNSEGQILQYLIHLKNQGYRDSTIEQKDALLHNLLKKGANLNEPETVKKAIASLESSESYKALLAIAYEGFAKRNSIAWTRPNYKQNSPVPFVPHETEIDALISGSGKKMAVLLLTLKETAMRLGEAWQLEWKDLDIENRTLTCNHPEKHSKARIFKISGQLANMLENLPKINQYVFNCGVRTQFGHEDIKTRMHNLKRQKALLAHPRKRIAEKLKNPRILNIHYHTFRHWKATQLYHQTKDVLYVMKFLGHRDVKNTLIYIDLEIACFSQGGDEYHAKTARTETEVLQLIEAGFEFVCDIGDAKIFRKRR
jgi:integrase